MRTALACAAALSMAPLAMAQSADLALEPTRPDHLVRVLEADDPNTSITEYTFPELGMVVRDVRRLLPDGTIERIGLDAQGNVVDVDALRIQNHQLETQRSGKIDSTLQARLDLAADSDVIEVGFWLFEPEDGIDVWAWLHARVEGAPDSEIAETMRAARNDARLMNEARLSGRVTQMADAIREVGGDILHEGMGWPLVIATVPVAEVPGLAAHPVVDTAYYSSNVHEHEGDNAQGTMRTYTVHDQGVLADGSVKVLVDDVGLVQNNIWLPPTIVLNSGGFSSHATGVAGNIANFHPQYFASSYTQPVLYDADDTGDSVTPGNWALAIEAGVDFGNCSWWNFLKGKIEMLDRFFDYTIRNYGMMMFKSCGNQGTSSTPYITTPGNGYNNVSTGNYNDGNDSNWANDFMTSSSSYWNPAEGHEKPEIASPGDGVQSTSGTSGLQSFGGTSSASPLTCGVATLMASYDNTLLSQMTTVKAMLMVSAWHNVEGAGVLSDKDGAGSTHAKAAHAVIRDGQWTFQNVTDASFPGDILDTQIELRANEVARVIAVWFSNADASYTTDVLDMDLDMSILDPSGTPILSSASTVNPFEIVGFFAPTTGTYTIRLTKQRFDGITEPLTIAWSTRNDAGTFRIELADSSPAFSLGNTPVFDVYDQYEGENNTFTAWGSLDPTPIPTGFGGGWVTPIGFDVLGQYLLGLPGWIGNLDASGNGQVSVMIPPNGSLVGTDVWFGAMMFSPAGPIEGPLGVSDPLKLTIGA